jgi:hypothetical protein
LAASSSSSRAISSNCPPSGWENSGPNLRSTRSPGRGRGWPP